MNQTGNTRHYSIMSSALTPYPSSDGGELRSYLAAIIESSQDAIIGTDPTGIITVWNPAAERLYGYQSKEAIGHPLALIYPTDRQGELHSALMQASRGESVSLHKSVRIRKDGSLFDVSVTVSAIKDQQGCILGTATISRDITDRRAAVQALQRFERLFNYSRDVILLMDGEGRILEANQAASALYGYHREELLSMGIHDLRAPETSHLTKDQLSRAGEVGIQFETVHRRKDRRCFPVEVSSRGALEGDRQVILSVIRDITERKRAEEERENLLVEMRRTAEKYRSLYSAMSEGVLLHEVIYDEKGEAADYRLLDSNPAFERITGIRREQALGELASKVYLTGEAPYLGIYARVAETGEPASFETTFDPMGKSFAISVFSPARGQFATVFQDITERVRASCERERLLSEISDLARESKRRAAELQSVLDNMVDAVFVCDGQGRLTLVNRAGLSLMGWERVEEATDAMRQDLGHLEIRHTDGRPEGYEERPLPRALAGETVVDEERIVRDPRTGRDRYLLTSAAPIKSEEEEVVSAVAVVRDVTALSELDRQKDQFIAVAAHELKTPVAIIKGHAQLLVRKAGDIPPDRRRLVDAIDQGTVRIDRIVQDLLDLSRLQTGRLDLRAEEFDLAALVAEAVDHVSLTTSRHALWLQSPRSIMARGDRGRIEQVVMNLIDNAIRYSPAGGSVIAEVRAKDGEIMVSVSDEGVGIPADKQSRIFERFFRAHTGTPHDYGGMGVALYISREIVSRHGGRIWFESTEGQGSAFVFSLPLDVEDGRSKSEEDNGSR